MQEIWLKTEFSRLSLLFSGAWIAMERQHEYA